PSLASRPTSGPPGRPARPAPPDRPSPPPRLLPSPAFSSPRHPGAAQAREFKPIPARDVDFAAPFSRLATDAARLVNAQLTSKVLASRRSTPCCPGPGSNFFLLPLARFHLALLDAATATFVLWNRRAC